ncbi:copia protein [Lasius niger]|uniref:Copia protein n=1 Tax=Lasius niger TaxID=67767 RepID=A0A0J7K8V3_LASNI|nr:copia protein [Lasius niger]
MGAITDRKFSFHSYRNRCEVRESNGALSAEGVRYGYLFRMLFNVKKPEECNVAQQESLKLWHERLGHINVKSIKETEEAGAVNGMKIEAGTDFFL